MKTNTRELLLFLLGAVGMLILIFILITLLAPRSEKVAIKPSLTAPARELRGVWVSRFNYTENLGITEKEAIQEYIRSSFQTLKNTNCNTVFFQVRGNGDVFYRSRYEPWSHMLTGTLGQDPGWDPLQFAVRTAHEYNLQLHAWINTFPCWRGTADPIPTNPPHPFAAHPDWVVCDSNGVPMPKSNHYVSFSPGNPEVQRHIRNIVLEIISNYDVDGIHFDYIRYPEGTIDNGYSHDAVSVARFNSRKSNPLKLDWENWQREQITEFLAGVYNTVMTTKPSVNISAAVLGNYNAPGWNGYYQVFQDAARWAAIGKIDLIVPMTYASRENGRFQTLIDRWVTLPNIRQPITPGLGAWTLPFTEILQEIEDVRKSGLDGVTFFAMSSFNDAQWDSLREMKFPHPAIPPAMPWKFNQPVPAPDNCTIQMVDDTLVMSWQKIKPAEKGNFIRNFVIYTSSEDSVDITDGSAIVAILPGSADQYTCQPDDTRQKLQYFIAALDAANNASEIRRFTLYPAQGDSLQ